MITKGAKSPFSLPIGIIKFMMCGCFCQTPFFCILQIYIKKSVVTFMLEINPLTWIVRIGYIYQAIYHTDQYI